MVMKMVIGIVLLCIGCASFAQDDPAKRFYLGVSTGLNNNAGLLGITGELQLVNNLSINGGLGVGSWGVKSGVGLKYYLHYPSGFSFNIGYARASGIDDIEIEMEQEFLRGQSGKQSIPFSFLPASVVNLSATKHWLIGKRKVNRFHLEFGYAVRTASDRYRTTALLSDDGKTFMRLLQPGGLILSTGFSFGI